MIKTVRAATILLAGLPSLALAAPPISEGRLGTLPAGEYVCALPGDATGAAWQPIPGHTFIIDNGSTYTTAAGSGIYLLTGDQLVFTRGPMRGQRYLRTGTATLRMLEADGKPGRVHCSRTNDPR